MSYGNRLWVARKNKGLSQNALAALSGVPQGTISKIERGDQESSTYDAVLADALSVSAIWLTKGKGEMSPTAHMGVQEQKSNYAAEPSIQTAAELGRQFMDALIQLEKEQQTATLTLLFGKEIAFNITRSKSQPINKKQSRRKSSAKKAEPVEDHKKTA